MIATALLLTTLLSPPQHMKGGKLFGYLMDYQIVASGDQGSVVDEDVVVANSVSSWDKLREKLGIDDAQNKKLSELHGPLGAMDWGREQVVFARSKEQPTGGYKLSILRLTKSSGNLVKLELLITPPKPDSMNMQVLTQPYLVFRMRKTDGHFKVSQQVAKKK